LSRLPFNNARRNRYSRIDRRQFRSSSLTFNRRLSSRLDLLQFDSSSLGSNHRRTARMRRLLLNSGKRHHRSPIDLRRFHSSSLA
jgi:hypothetical protein